MGPWNDEYNNVAGLAISSSASYGPLIAVETAGAVTKVKEGSLTATWNDEYHNAAQVAVAG
jgi:hypothetical protein